MGGYVEDRDFFEPQIRGADERDPGRGTVPDPGCGTLRGCAATRRRKPCPDDRHGFGDLEERTRFPALTDNVSLLQRVEHNADEARIR